VRLEALFQSPRSVDVAAVVQAFVNMASATERRRTSSHVQTQWRKQVEDEIRSGSCKQFKKDWTNIRPLFPERGQLTPDFYYCRPLAVFIPHLIVPDHTPWCPVCRSNANVHTENYRFTENSKPLFGLHEQRELHSVLYTCYGGTGQHTFVAHHPVSLRLGGPKLLGIFRFFVADQFAIDETLHSFIINQPYTPTVQLSRTLKAMVEKKYVSDLIEYLTRALRGESRRVRTAVAAHDNRQNLIRNYATAPSASVDEVSKAARLLNKAKSDLASYKGLIERSRRQAEDPINVRFFADAKNTKKGNKAPNIRGLGPAKAMELASAGFETFRQFVNEWKDHLNEKGSSERVLAILEKRGSANRQKDPSNIVHEWAKAAHEYLRGRRKEYESKLGRLQELEQAKDVAQTQYNAVAAALVVASDGNDNTNNGNSASTMATRDSDGEGNVIPFTSMLDKNGYNAKLLSSDRIESVLQTYFLDRREYMETSMMQLHGRGLPLTFFILSPRGFGSLRTMVREKDSSLTNAIAT